MRIPVTPPTLNDALESFQGKEGLDRLSKAMGMGIGPAPGGRYRHWDTLRHVAPPDGMTSEDWWSAIKFARSQNKRSLPLVDRNRKPFTYCLSDPVLELLHEIDSHTTGPIASNTSITNPQTRDRYVQSALIEEAITSSQLEGAATTREVAKEMIRSGRDPIDKSELMILNNYQAIKLIRGLAARDLSADLIFELHKTITAGTIEENALGHYLRSTGDGIAIYDDRDNKLLHDPPSPSEIAWRLEAMCKFANEEAPGVFLHPVIKAIILHFWLAYDHPFIDGNGRTARALFYWSMLKQGYWLFEFLSISRIIRGAPAKYGRSFLYTETDENDLTYFILAQLKIVKRSIDELHVYLARKTKEIRETEQRLRATVSLNHRQVALISHALRHPGSRYTIESHRMSHDVTYQTSRTDLLSLEDKSLLVRSRQGRAFSFSAPGDLDDRLRNLVD
jgi:Fic family protein